MRNRARRPSGLRWRLTAWVAGVLLISAAVVFAVVYTSTGSQISSQIDHDIAAETSQLAQALKPLKTRGATQVATLASRYVHAQPYSVNSSLLFVIVPGAGTISNHPELFGTRVPDDGETSAEQAQENLRSLQLRIPTIGYTIRRIADVGQVRVLERAVTVSGRPVVVGAGEPLALVERAQHGVARAFVLAGALTLLLALLASYLAGARVTAPLRRLAAVAARVDAGELGPRMDPPAGARNELRVLAVTFNHMLDRLELAFAGQRAFIADASHELRTPLTVIRGQLEVLAASDAPTPDEVRRVERLLQAEVTRISRLVDDLLVLAQAEQTDFLRVADIDLDPFVSELWDGLSLTASRRFSLGSIPRGTLRADPDRLAQALRNLARNAIEHTAQDSGVVRLEVELAGPGRVRFAILDDGPGIAPLERERVFERFHRTDPARNRASGGAGLGLAIVRAITDAHGGEVRALSRDSAAGARVELILPAFAPA